MNLDIHPHFRAVFDIEPKTSDILWGQVVRTIREWIADREEVQQSSQKFWAAWMFTGGLWVNKATKSRVTTDREIGAGTEGFPQYWSLRWEHPDSSMKWRSWRSDVGLTRTDAGGVRVSVLNSHWVSSDYVGPEPTVPAASSPNLVKQILTDTRWTCKAGDVQLSGLPRAFEVGEGHLFVQLIESAHRACPVVYVSRRYPEGDLPLDTRRLARNLSGVAVVAEAPSSVFDKETEQLLPQVLRCWGGRVRIYYPGANIHNERRHRYFEPSFIAEVGSEAVEAIIVRAVTRWALTSGGGVLTSLEDVASRRSDARLARLREELKAGYSAAQMDAFIDEAASQENEYKKTVNDLSDKLTLAEWEKQEQEGAIEQLNQDLGSAKRALSFAEKQRALVEKQKAELAAKAEAVTLFSSLPASLEEILDRIATLFPDRIVLTSEARKGARRAGINQYSGEIAGLWKWVWSVATVLHDLYFDGDSGDITRRYGELTEFEFAHTETGSTKNDNHFLRLREVVVDGKTYQTMAHVKYGSKPKWARLYLAPDHELRKLIIGHCGDHLETAGTRRQK